MNPINLPVLIINLPSASERLAFQQQQLQHLQLAYQVLPAVSRAEITDAHYQTLGFGWQRPLRKTEIACFLSHQTAWEWVHKNQQAALILEDDAVLAKQTPVLLAQLKQQTACDLVSLEVRSRKKLVGKTTQALPLAMQPYTHLLPLYQDRTGAAAYVLWPSGAAILLAKAQHTQPALADAFISSTYALRSFQVEPAAAVQLDQCAVYGFPPPLQTQSFIDAEQKPATIAHDQRKLRFRYRRLVGQLHMAWRQLSVLGRSERRKINLQPADFT